jgi:Cu(I)/Ag(I) efflux system membrane protein CusA/SilA
MIETMVSFRPVQFWPRRKMTPSDAAHHSEAVLVALVERQLVEAPDTAEARQALLESTASTGLARIDGLLREFAYQRNNEFCRSLSHEITQFTVERVLARAEKLGVLREAAKAGDVARIIAELPPALAGRVEAAPAREDVMTIADHAAQTAAKIGLVPEDSRLLADSTSVFSIALGSMYEFAGRERPSVYSRLYDDVRKFYSARWSQHVRQLNAELIEQAAIGYTRILIEEHIAQARAAPPGLQDAVNELRAWRLKSSSPSAKPHHGGQHSRRLLALPPGRQWQPQLDEVQNKLADEFKSGLVLWEVERSALIGFGGELDAAVQMPGWTNVWTMPIQNRVDMLATGVNTAIGIKITGRNLEDIAATSARIADAIKKVPGAVDVVADPVRGKGYLEISVDRERAAELGVNVGDANDVVEVALGGRQVTTTVEGRSRHPVVMRFARPVREDEDAIKSLPVLAVGRAENGAAHATSAAATAEVAAAPDDSHAQASLLRYVPLRELAEIRITEGPATLKSENGLLRNYVRCNVRDRGAIDFVQEARRAISAEVTLPEGVFLEWTGRFESDARARRTLAWVIPLVLASILFILYLTYRDLVDALLMLLAVPGAIAGGVFFQWLSGFAFSITVWIGYIACFGMAAATGIIMLVYLREALQKSGGLENMTLDDVRQATLQGAAHRLRPKLLTEATTIIGLAPMLWASGPGAEIIRPMVAPVLGGILIADEVIDLLLPVLFYHVRRRRWLKLHRPSQQAPSPSHVLSTLETSSVSDLELVRK